MGFTVHAGDRKVLMYLVYLMDEGCPCRPGALKVARRASR
jgi:hypothetical protein